MKNYKETCADCQAAIQNNDKWICEHEQIPCRNIVQCVEWEPNAEKDVQHKFKPEELTNHA